MVEKTSHLLSPTKARAVTDPAEDWSGNGKVGPTAAEVLRRLTGLRWFELE